ncbi:host nuclease inhibitor protein [Bradyrhizobium sp. 4]|uniref:hypothetical protein n=1 Tax=unclassified Bradyrhizobium TaxID=2631580 RepID=UPI001FF7174E|nr:MULTISPECIES: hypothetical protein [unclassified Bradyrhizobium]MCK1402064.1 host nuclease inhibitor protein [Bradyrhizobium sp. 39]MCK1751216.1 host nuclease inhibitor protein [Bradyrhizobium sp. 135]UPJ38472.1 host nuclease inhibitor protein [Bradyrhizobium sp. 4]
MIRAYCYASGLIEFGLAIPKGPTVIARGPEAQLRAFIGGNARQARLYRNRKTLDLVVPGMPEAESQLALDTALGAWSKWIAANAPKGVRVLRR